MPFARLGSRSCEKGNVGSGAERGLRLGLCATGMIEARPLSSTITAPRDALDVPARNDRAAGPDGYPFEPPLG
jgi:hypothetical protein